MPFTLENVDEEKLDAGLGDAKGGTGPTGDVLSVEEVVLQLRLGDLRRLLAVELRHLPHGAGVALLSSLALTGELQGPHGLGVVVGHRHTSPLR
jgi:hypothetical protein